MADAQAGKQFHTLNLERIKRLGSLLPVKHRLLLDLLPLLFHTNAKLLPGYINAEAPVGIVDYQPSKQTVDAAKKHHNKFVYKHRALRYYSLRALYLIGEDGLHHHNPKEQFELWLIYAQPLSEAQCTLLAQKADAISAWAQSEKFLLTIRLFDEATLNKDTFSSFDLDRFYTSGLLLAGCEPSWWTADLHDHKQASTSQRFTKDTINFGDIPSHSKQALFERSVNCFIKALEQGLESCLDLIYLTYLLEHPTSFEPLSYLLKQAVIAGEVDPMFLDINSLKLAVLTQQLTDDKTLSVAQQSLYIQSKESLSKKIKQAAHPWRRAFIASQVSAWQWQDEVTIRLDHKSQSHYRQVLPLFQLVRIQLANMLTALSRFSKRYKLNTASQQRQLQQKFDHLFSDKPDTLPRLPTAFIPKQTEYYIYLYRTQATSPWCIDDQTNVLSKTPLYQHDSLINVLSWAVSNHLLSKSTRLKVADNAHAIKITVILELVQHLLRSPLHKKPININTLQLTNPAAISQLQLFTNFAIQTDDPLGQHGLEISTLQDDPLNYANKKQNLITQIEGLIHSDHDQWHYFIYSGEDCLLQMLAGIIYWQAATLSLSQIACWSHHPNHGPKINARLKKIVHHVITHYKTNPDNGDYIISLGGQLYQLHWQQHLCDISPLAKNTSLLQYLSNIRQQAIATAIDPRLDEDGLFTTILRHQSNAKITVFLFTEHHQTILYILDNAGRLFKQQFRTLTQETLLTHFNAFLTTATRTMPAVSHAFVQLQKHPKQGFKTLKLALTPSSQQQHHLPVIIEMESADEAAHCTIQCGAQTFSGAANKPELFSRVRDLVLSLRRKNNHYHLYITQLTFKQENTVIYDYLIQKQRIEYLLNKLSP